MSVARVVMVEDDQWFADTVKRQLEKNGMEVVVAHDGPTAIDVIDDEMPDVIVLDMLLRTTTGMALLHELRSYKDLASIPVVILSSIAERIPTKDLKLYGIVEVFDKATMMVSELEASIRRHSS